DRSPLPSPARVEVHSSRSAVSAVAAARGQCSPAWLSSRASRPLKPSLGFVPHIVPTPSRRRSRRSGCGGSLSGLSPIQAIRLHTRSGDIPAHWPGQEARRLARGGDDSTCLIGRKVSTVAFVMDYVAFMFNGLVLARNGTLRTVDMLTC